MTINLSGCASIKLLKQYLNEDDIAPLISVLDDIVENPQDEALLERLSGAFNDLGSMQGAVLTYAPYIAIVLSDSPFNNSD